MRIIVTGAAGWLGGIVYDHFLKEHEVLGVDVKRSDRTWLFPKDLSRGGLAIKGYETVFHFAAMANVNDVVKDPMKTVESNILATARMLETVRDFDIKKFFYISTGWCQLWPQNTHPYTATKKAGEMLCQSWGKTYQTPYKIMRLGTLYGPGARTGTAIANFVTKALKREPITIFGEGKAKRRYLFTDDLVSACERALSVDCKPGIHDIYDICGAEDIVVLDVADMVKKVVKDVPIKFEPARVGDLDAEIAPHYELACHELNWEPKIKLEEGIKQYADWMEGQL